MGRALLVQGGRRQRDVRGCLHTTRAHSYKPSEESWPGKAGDRLKPGNLEKEINRSKKQKKKKSRPKKQSLVKRAESLIFAFLFSELVGTYC